MGLEFLVCRIASVPIRASLTNRVRQERMPLLADALELEGVRSVGGVKMVLIYGR